jgi:hypothetical protein
MTKVEFHGIADTFNRLCSTGFFEIDGSIFVVLICHENQSTIILIIVD